jgi:hypothetical protein
MEVIEVKKLGMRQFKIQNFLSGCWAYANLKFKIQNSKFPRFYSFCMLLYSDGEQPMTLANRREK